MRGELIEKTGGAGVRGGRKKKEAKGEKNRREWVEEKKGENEKWESSKDKVEGKGWWKRKSKAEGTRRTEKLRKYALERSVSFAISRACIRLDAHQVVHEFRKGESGARRDTEAYEANETWKHCLGHTNLAGLGLTRPWRTDNNESREAKAKYCTLEQRSTNGGSRVPFSRQLCSRLSRVQYCSGGIRGTSFGPCRDKRNAAEGKNV